MTIPIGIIDEYLWERVFCSTSVYNEIDKKGAEGDLIRTIQFPAAKVLAKNA
jgi:hypothetical protein